MRCRVTPSANPTYRRLQEAVPLAGLTGAYQMLNESGSARIETMWGVALMLKLFLFVIVMTMAILLVASYLAQM